MLAASNMPPVFNYWSPILGNSFPASGWYIDFNVHSTPLSYTTFNPLQPLQFMNRVSLHATENSIRTFSDPTSRFVASASPHLDQQTGSDQGSWDSVLPKISTESSQKNDSKYVSLFCRTCQLTLNSPGQARQHYRGRAHARRVELSTKKDASSMKENITCSDNIHGGNCDPFNGSSARSMTTILSSREYISDVPRFNQTWKQGSIQFNECCRTCDIAFNSEVQAVQHYAGKTHRKRARIGKLQKRVKTGGEMRSSHTVPGCVRDARQRDLGHSIYGSKHFQASNHPFISVSGRCRSARHRLDKMLAKYRTPSGMFYCATCDVTFETERRMIRHLEEKTHRRK